MDESTEVFRRVILMFIRHRIGLRQILALAVDAGPASESLPSHPPCNIIRPRDSTAELGNSTVDCTTAMIACERRIIHSLSFFDRNVYAQPSSLSAMHAGMSHPINGQANVGWNPGRHLHIGGNNCASAAHVRGCSQVVPSS